MDEILDDLNSPQREAVTAPFGHLLILAGAGSGKTRVLTQRIVWLIKMQHVSPFAILAVTFTNKAASEMRGRIEQLLQQPCRSFWVGTFHGIAHRLLRRHYKEAGLPETFQIIDTDDQYRLVKRIIRALDLDENRWPPKQVQWYINNNKDKGLRAQKIEANDHHTNTLLRIYTQYQDVCQRGGLVDFAELLLKSYELLRSNNELLAHYQNRFQHILVDEFQDTNTIQYAFLKLLLSENNYMMAVGDDDQSIYGWRGAKIENMQTFCDELKNVTTIRLEQNYRSTGNILSAANALISNNPKRLGKTLWTEHHAGDLISLYSAFNEIDEARFIVERIKEWLDEGHRAQECAILYRSNAQSRVLEEALLQQNIAYRVYGGLRFFERAEIKDVLAYLRLIANPNDDAAFERVVNLPTRGIGDKTVANMRDFARANTLSLWHAAKKLINTPALTPRASQSVSGFLQLIEKLERDTEELHLSEQVDHVIHHSGLVELYQKEKGEKGQARIENLAELVTATGDFIPPETEEGEMSTPLIAFLAHAALEAGEQQANKHSDCVQLMTLHSAKGLEFPLVFLSGLEDGLFPHRMCLDDASQLAEERRLCYVGMTRAMQKLVITYAETRRLHGSEEFRSPSRFLQELPQSVIQEVRLKNQVTRPVYNDSQDINDTGLTMGQHVRHHKFGDGVILNVEGHGEYTRVQVNFASVGSKWLVLAYANLETT